ncbi:alpha/beta hydrolase [Bartonella sp. W8098]|uniref:alpha/beta hydrolase n=1 Tax=Bartonella TaxID=773 RepID=UPI0018DECD31|nr:MULTISPECIES: alpha/beta hydrolase [Bartonella]MBH9986940.1 alpha/beta hydrolase [Bartonella apis]MBI0171010.1 alpha/beta hydrolase [Bartonella sp. W8151]
MENGDLEFLTVGHQKLAIRALKGSKHPGLMWLPGYRSHMMGGKALALNEFAKSNDYPFLRFDYSGTGESEGDFHQGSISKWLEESLILFEKFCQGPQIIAGSSMGGWIALRMAQILAKKNIPLAGLLLLAPAPDFTRDLVRPQMTDEQKKELDKQGFFEVPYEKDMDPVPFTKIFLDDGDKNLVMEGLIDINCPVHIIQGMADNEVPYQHTLELVEHLPFNNVTLTLVKDGEHHLSRPEDIAIILDGLKMLIENHDH